MLRINYLRTKMAPKIEGRSETLSRVERKMCILVKSMNLQYKTQPKFDNVANSFLVATLRLWKLLQIAEKAKSVLITEVNSTKWIFEIVSRDISNIFVYTYFSEEPAESTKQYYSWMQKIQFNLANSVRLSFLYITR